MMCKCSVKCSVHQELSENYTRYSVQGEVELQDYLIYGQEENNGNLVHRCGMSIVLRPKCLGFLASTLFSWSSDVLTKKGRI